MLNIRNLVRFCKQPLQCTVGRTSMYFSSSSDDDSKKFPPDKSASNIESLDDILNASFQPSKVVSKGKKVQKQTPSIGTAAKSHLVQARETRLPNNKAFTDSGSARSLEDLLNVAYTHSKGDRLAQEKETDTEVSLQSPQISTQAVEPRIMEKPKIDLAIKKQAHKLSSKELLDRVKKIAKEVAHGAGPQSSKVADELLGNLQLPKEDKPINLSELTYQKGVNKETSDHSLDLLRNRIVSEEHVYNSAEAPWETARPRKYSQQRSESRTLVIQNVDLSLHPDSTLGIFAPDNKEGKRSETFLHTFDRLEKRDLWLGQKYAPRNWFEQCIQWTEQGKLWHFPINNEQGLEEAATVSFTEHIFLEDHLEGWCPNFGPIRHFMELVCIGLSKNPYLSVEEKIDNIMWYRDYFEKNKDILEAAGTLNRVVTEVPQLETQ